MEKLCTNKNRFINIRHGFLMARLSIKILEMKLHIQSSVKSIGKRKKKTYFFKTLL
jgi:hypothetical protein